MQTLIIVIECFLVLIGGWQKRGCENERVATLCELVRMQRMWCESRNGGGCGPLEVDERQSRTRRCPGLSTKSSTRATPRWSERPLRELADVVELKKLEEQKKVKGEKRGCRLWTERVGWGEWDRRISVVKRRTRVLFVRMGGKLKGLLHTRRNWRE